MKISELKNKIAESNPDVVKRVSDDFAYQIGKEVMSARIIRGYTQVQLAKMVGTKQSSIARLESGMFAATIPFLKRIAKALKTDLILPKFTVNHREISINNDVRYEIKAHIVFPQSDVSINAPISSVNNPEEASFLRNFTNN